MADPEGGTAWVFLDHNIIEEAKVMGVGLPAEYGNFTGVIFNIVTKSGRERVLGALRVRFPGREERQPRRFLAAGQYQGLPQPIFPTLTAPRYKFLDANMHLGGPIKKDKIWFYQGFQYQKFWDYATGLPGRPPRL